MPSVTVDLDDLETLVMTTGALKTIEGALNARKDDPFIRGHLDFTDAHNRLATAMRNAKRVDAGTLVPWDGELDKAEIALLREIDAQEDMMILTGKQKAPEPGKAMSVADQLMCKGCIQIGQLVKGVMWAGETKPILSLESFFPVRITDRGREKLTKLDLNAGYKKADEAMKDATIKPVIA